jgi:hemolysin activation/secretion protein
MFVALPAAAQSAIDRVDPARAEERAQMEAVEPSDDQSAALPPAVEPPSDTAGGPTFLVGAIDLVGLKVLPRQDFADVIDDYVGRSLSASELSELANRLAARARATYPLASASIEPQALRAGVLRVQIDEGTVDEIRLDGPQNRAVLAVLQPLVSGMPVTAAQLERRLLIAGDIDGVSLGQTRVVQEDGRNVLLVKLGYRAFRANVTLDNDSTDPVGPLEVFGSMRFNGLLSDSDSLQLFALDSLPEPGELFYGRARYNARISPSGTEVALSGSFSRSEPGAYLKPFEIEGQSWVGSVGLSHPLLRSRDTSLWIDGALSHRHSRRHRADALVRDDRLTIARAGLYGFSQVAGGRLRVNASVAQGLDVLGATERGDPLASRTDADGTFTALTMSADWEKGVVGGLGVNLAVRSQVASQPLLLSEEFGIGGASFVRGYDYSERSGDEGVAGYAELNYRFDGKVGPLNGLQVYAFADGGWVNDFDDGQGGSSLFSGGSGLRLDVDPRTDASFELAVPLSDDRSDTDNKNPRVRFSITRYF